MLCVVCVVSTSFTTFKDDFGQQGATKVHHTYDHHKERRAKNAITLDTTKKRVSPPSKKGFLKSYFFRRENSLFISESKLQLHFLSSHHNLVYQAKQKLKQKSSCSNL